eukprot:359498-Chlamydomonas_euryale.AAC.10
MEKEEDEPLLTEDLMEKRWFVVTDGGPPVWNANRVPTAAVGSQNMCRLPASMRNTHWRRRCHYQNSQHTRSLGCSCSAKAGPAWV